MNPTICKISSLDNNLFVCGRQVDLGIANDFNLLLKQGNLYVDCYIVCGFIKIFQRF